MKNKVPDMTGYIAELEFIVRDYECDLQGVVNNANYLHYLEHARHELLISRGISFSLLHEEGTDLIVTKAEIEYKFPLRSRDRFMVRTAVRKEGLIRLAFIQDIFRIPDEKLIVKAKVTGIATREGKPVRFDSIFTLLGLT
ncbi:MAG TPA: acyl-CoA thioesterase [Bacteroidales bacterium]|jgi:acyl-CoA thioester hydrolase|nr:acyl-CoA thioesterase [Bacteroidales bacterium]HOS70852.1 acyl-CoA thioesterase [Bacteroidales bacterium]HQH23163.1 acyl-CoA thioesterase [Bacteroidales bacterium]HQJ80979.1 acyl-CoA thioesterase [Bacteroidales bacterium]